MDTLKEVTMTGKWVRRFHRWMVVFFTVSVLVTTVAVTREEPIVWVSYVPLLPLTLLFLTGLYLFALPYTAKRRAVRHVRP